MKEKFPSIYKEPIETLQINIGYKCNQACKHCHVNSSPLRTEKMSNEMISLIPKIIEKYKIKTCLLYTSPSPRDIGESRMPSSA